MEKKKMLVVSIQRAVASQQSATLKCPGEQGRRWLNERRKVMKRFSSVDGGMQCWRRLHEVEQRKGKRVISQLLFRWYYLFLTCALPLTHAEDTRMAPFQRPCVISPPTPCSACWWWMPDKRMNAGRKEMLTGSHITGQQKKKEKEKSFFFFFVQVRSSDSLSQLEEKHWHCPSVCLCLCPPLQARCLSVCSWCPSRSSSAPFGWSLYVASAPGVSVSW